MAANGTENGQIPLMLIHGAWLSARSWENYADYFAKRGFDVSAPEWPRKEGDVEEMRETAEASAGLGVQEIVDHYAQLIEAFDQPPVLIGHSYGGPVRRAAARPRARPGRGGDESGAAEGNPRAAVLDSQVGRSRAGASVEVARRGHVDARGVHLRVREHVLGGGRGRRVRALRGPRDRPDLLRGRVRELPSAPADRGPFQERGSSAAADRRAPQRTTRCPLRCRRRSTSATSARRPRPTTSSSRVARIFTWSAADWQEVAAAVDSWLDGVLDAPVAATSQGT